MNLASPFQLQSWHRVRECRVLPAVARCRVECLRSRPPDLWQRLARQRPLRVAPHRAAHRPRLLLRTRSRRPRKIFLEERAEGLPLDSALKLRVSNTAEKRKTPDPLAPVWRSRLRNRAQKLQGLLSRMNLIAPSTNSFGSFANPPLSVSIAITPFQSAFFISAIRSRGTRMPM